MGASKKGFSRTQQLRSLASIVERLGCDYSELKSLPMPHRRHVQPHLDVSTDAWMAKKNETKGRSGYFIFRRSADSVHPIYWSGRELRRVARRNLAAEILTSTEATSMGL